MCRATPKYLAKTSFDVQSPDGLADGGKKSEDLKEIL